MLIGQYEHTLEEKGRLQIPKSFRESLQGGAIVTKGLDGCLFLYPREKWQSLIEKISTLPITKSDARAFSRLLTYGANEVQIDRVGRILIPAYLRDYALIKSEVIVAGNLDKIEIWDKTKFLQYQDKIEKNSDQIAEKLTDINI